MSEIQHDEKTKNDDQDSIDEDIEPKLKYLRMSNDLQSILIKDAASCIAVHPKFLCLGTHYGTVHLLDHQGNIIRGNRPNPLPKHTISVNQISIDHAGENIASCSGDGKIHVAPLFASRDPDDQTINIGRSLREIALDPSPNASGGKRLVVGDDKLTLYERAGFLGRWRSTVLCEAEGHVKGISWGDDFIAWASILGVRVYDIIARCSLGLIKWENTSNNLRCNLRWCGRTLLIGWQDTVRVCVIRKRSTTGTASIGLPDHIVDPISTFRTPDLLISGLAPLGGTSDQLVLLGTPKDTSDTSQRPQLHIVEFKESEYIELCTDSLSLKDYQNWTCDDYRLDVLTDEDRLFIISPKDIVVASPYDLDDRVQWLVQHSRFEDALSAVREAKGSNQCRKHTEQSIAGVYLDNLLAQNRFQDAARLCLNVFGRDRTPWQEYIYKFARVHQLRAVAPYLPRDISSPLDPQIYEMVLYEHLRLEPSGFLKLVNEWREPKGLYNTAAVINAVLERLLVSDNDDKPSLMEALAILYSIDGRCDKALAMYLKLGHPGVFELIRKNISQLKNAIPCMIVDLMSLNSEKACELLLNNQIVKSETIVENLQQNEALLYAYLHALDRKDPKTSAPYHGKMVRLYSIFDYDKLLPFLKRSDQYPIQEALEICQERKYYPEMVYLLGRIGDTREALELINRELKDVQQALSFCQEHDDPDLWRDLIEHSLEKPELITFLLPRIGGHVDPRDLVQKIQSGVKIPGLRQALVSMLRQGRLQVNIQEGCQKLLVNDYFGLHEKLVFTQKKGLSIGDDLVCGACHRKLLGSMTPASAKPLVVYNCKHSFHEQCLPLNADKLLCGICNPHQKNSTNGLPANR